MTTEAIERPDTSTEVFADRVFGSTLATMDLFSIFLGEKLGLYQAIADHGPLTRDELTRHAEIHWRYAQEWLEQQAVSGILQVDKPAAPADERRYSLPEGHADVLLNPDSVAYLAPLGRMVVAAALKLPDLVEAYRTGGGVSWGELGPDVRTGQAEMNRPWYLHSIGSDWFPQVPGLHARLSEGAQVADIGCGEGWSSIAIARAYPKVTVDAYDVDAPSVEAARRHAAREGVSDRVRFHQVDAAELDLDGIYDVVVGFEFLHDLPHPVEVLATMRRMAKPNGYVLIMDERVPDEFIPGDEIQRIFYGFSLFACLPDGMSHQPSAATGTVMRPSTLRRYAREAGFADIEILPIENELWRFYRFVD